MRTAEAEAAAAEIATGGRVIAIQADVAGADAVARMVVRTEAELGPVSILVNKCRRIFLTRRFAMELGRRGVTVNAVGRAGSSLRWHELDAARRSSRCEFGSVPQCNVDETPAVSLRSHWRCPN
jgi:NAD(P)-dependent dehydrogenase (short-subunit alcohol dehydrogenase family)